MPCEDCGGTGADSGALADPEACPSCKGSGVEPAPEVFTTLDTLKAAREALSGYIDGEGSFKFTFKGEKMDAADALSGLDLFIENWENGLYDAGRQ